jgi:hypothetical protein
MSVVITDLNLEQARLVEQFFISTYTKECLDNMRREIALKNLDKFKHEYSILIEIYAGMSENEMLNYLQR